MFGLGTFARDGGSGFPGLVMDDHVLDLRPHFGSDASTGQLLSSWDASLAQLHEIASRSIDGLPRLETLRPLPPVQPIGQLFCAGANYRKHLTEILISMGDHRSEADRRNAVSGEAAEQLVEAHAASGTPFVFAMPTSAMSGACDDVVLWGPGVEHDWELELALVIGSHARNVSPADAMACVAGYTISNDISTRDVMFRPHLAMTDFLMTKGRPGFFPTGPYLVPREFVDDYRRLRITLSVNEELMQDEYVEDIIFGVEDLVAYASTITDLWPGDILLTGSPSGNAGHHSDRWLRPGDVIEGRISKLGSLRNRCVADGSSSAAAVSGGRQRRPAEGVDRSTLDAL